MVHTLVDPSTCEARSARTLRHLRSGTLYVGRIPPHVEQPRMEHIALYAV